MGDQEQMGDADALGLRRGDPAWGLFAVGAGPRWLEPLIRRYWRAGRRPDVTRFNCIGTIWSMLSKQSCGPDSEVPAAALRSAQICRYLWPYS